MTIKRMRDYKEKDVILTHSIQKAKNVKTQ